VSHFISSGTQRRLLAGLLAVATAVGVVSYVVSAPRIIKPPESVRLEGASAASSYEAEDLLMLRSAVDTFPRRGGAWMPGLYSSSSWEKYQTAVVGDAVLGARRGGGLGRRQIAQETVDLAIARHQLPDGDFDNGTHAAGSSGVSGGFWAEAEGLVALVLRPYIRRPLFADWVGSMERYADYLMRSGETKWYANGNVVLRTAVVLLETYRLAELNGGRNAARLWRAYTFELRFLTDPATRGKGERWSWLGYGERSNGNGGTWFVETADSRPNRPPLCANGDRPCSGFDPNYTEAQLNDANLADALGVNRQFWLNVIRGEFTTLKPRIDNGMLNASDGSRDSVGEEVFFPQIFGVLQRAGVGHLNSYWRTQTRAIRDEVKQDERESDPGPNAFNLVLALAIPLTHIAPADAARGHREARGTTHAPMRRVTSKAGAASVGTDFAGGLIPHPPALNRRDGFSHGAVRADQKGSRSRAPA